MFRKPLDRSTLQLLINKILMDPVPWHINILPLLKIQARENNNMLHFICSSKLCQILSKFNHHTLFNKQAV